MVPLLFLKMIIFCFFNQAVRFAEDRRQFETKLRQQDNAITDLGIELERKELAFLAGDQQLQAIRDLREMIQSTDVTQLFQETPSKGGEAASSSNGPSTPNNNRTSPPSSSLSLSSSSASSPFFNPLTPPDSPANNNRTTTTTTTTSSNSSPIKKY